MDFMHEKEGTHKASQQGTKGTHLPTTTFKESQKINADGENRTRMA